MSGNKHSFGFIGLGNMGSHMARNLASYAREKGSPQVLLWNRTAAKIEHMREETYCDIASTIEDLARQCDIIHTCLANDEVALDVYRRILSAARSRTILVDHSTLFPTTSSILQAEAAKVGSSFLSCPIFGPPAAAKAAGLLIVMSGDAEARATVGEYVVPAIGKASLDCGDETSKGALLKILGNNCILGTIELLSESFTLAEKTGFDPNLFYKFIETWFPAPSWVNYGRKIRDGAFSGAQGFTIPGGMKDAAFIRRLGDESSTPTPIIDQAWSHLTTAKAIGGEGLDWSSCAAGMRVTAGLPPFKGEDFSMDKSRNDVNGSVKD
ncbi:NAD(P)-binding protein [Rhizodiscina lignyota]|uniref:NAD(P)-binding protein n=1 Tax=Rhizodiscina lignyota TaxID=1504668 RepID=A0A9P4MAF7_9PEZI|nr:NAD(P)-binding protein [Rhizodiscina lignyota]